MTSFNFCCIPGANMMHDTIEPKSNMIAYIMRVDVEFRHDGIHEQHKLHAALPQQHAS